MSPRPALVGVEEDPRAVARGAWRSRRRSKAPLPLISPWETGSSSRRSARRCPGASVSPLTSCSLVLKKTLEPSLEAPSKKAPKAPLPLICPGRPGSSSPRSARRRRGAVGVAADQLLVGVEEDLRAVARGAAEAREMRRSSQGRSAPHRTRPRSPRSRRQDCAGAPSGETDEQTQALPADWLFSPPLRAFYAKRVTNPARGGQRPSESSMARVRRADAG